MNKPVFVYPYRRIVTEQDVAHLPPNKRPIGSFYQVRIFADYENTTAITPFYSDLARVLIGVENFLRAIDRDEIYIFEDSPKLRQLADENTSLPGRGAPLSPADFNCVVNVAKKVTA